MPRRAASLVRLALPLMAACALLRPPSALALPEKAVPQAGARGREGPAAAVLARLGALTGDWEGSFEWIGTGRRGAMNARYFTTGNGSAVVETLIMDGVPSMTTVYHSDGPDLRMTHYCAAGNQPRLKASRIDLARGALDFSFVDATNLSSSDSSHVTGLELRLVDDDHVTLMFLFEGGGKASREQIILSRTRPKA